jgi:hypothetical protein
MRIYEGGPRQDWEEVLRSVGAHLDESGMRNLIFLESDTGLIVQGTTVVTESGSAWNETMGTALRQTLILDDDKVGTFIDEALARRGRAPESTPRHYELQLRVIGRFLDEKKPRDLLLFEVDGAYIARLTLQGQGGVKHELVEFTPEDIADLIAKAPDKRRSEPPAKSG